eukprot:38712_1
MADLVKWKTNNPTHKLSFFYFFTSIFVPPALGIYYYFMDGDAALIHTASGIFAMLLCIYAFYHFKILFGLRQEINNTHRLNTDFMKQNIELKTDVNRLESAGNELQKTCNKLHEIHTKQRENNEKFKMMQTNMRAANLDSIKGIFEIRKKINKYSDSWTTSLHSKQRKVFVSLFERFENKHSNIYNGMCKEEFDELCALLPNEYKERFGRLGTFTKLANNKSYINYKDFECCLDLFHEMNVKNIDMDFKIQFVENKNIGVDDGNMPQFIRQVSVTKTTLPGQKFNLSDIEFEHSIIVNGYDIDDDIQQMI